MYGFTIVVLLSAAMYTDAATALFPVEENPAEFADQEGCYLKHLNKVIPYGDYYPEKTCSKYSCHSSKTTQLFTCGALHVDKSDPCHIVNGDATQAYPSCCPWVMCSTIPPEVLTSEDTASVLEQTTQALEVEATSESTLDQEGPFPPDEILVAQPSLNQ